MSRRGLLFLLPLCLYGKPAQADLPDFVLDKDYNACIADGTDAARNAYCACVRDGMRGWSIDEYLALVAQATSAAGSGAPPVPPRLKALAEQCLPHQ